MDCGLTSRAGPANRPLARRTPHYVFDRRALLESEGITPIRLPAKSPNLNAFAKRFVLTNKSECLNRWVSVRRAP